MRTRPANPGRAIAPEVLFWLKVYQRGDCWEWRGYLNAKTGYGRFNLNGTSINAHRFAFELAKGTIPVGLEPDHLCRHRWCVKPSHLEAVMHSVNVARGAGNQNRSKTHCQNGHAFDRVRVIQTGKWAGLRQRICTTCERARQARYRMVEPAGVGTVA